MKANVAVSETGVAADPDSPMSFSMEGFSMMTPAALMSSFWTPGWNSAQSITRFQEEVNGPLEGGDPGVRLIEPIENSEVPYFEPSNTGGAQDGALIAAPLHHIFGSEELSALSPGIAELAPQPYVMLHPNDAQRAGLADGDSTALTAGDTVLNAPVRVSESIAPGVVGVPAGLAGAPFIDFAARVSIAKERAR
jgi:NADH-quinone oxidoreductase subunit G